MSTLEEVKTAPTRSPERASSGGVGGWWANGRAFLTEVRNEMRRVTWPSRREVYATTVVDIVRASCCGVYLWGLDLALSWAVGRIFGLFGAA